MIKAEDEKKRRQKRRRSGKEDGIIRIFST